jgi:hypothetical protein
MKPGDRKSRLVSFRVSPDKYTKLCEACEVRGIVSVSELARLALDELIGLNSKVQPIERQLSGIENRLQTLKSEVDKLAQVSARRTR